MAKFDDTSARARAARWDPTSQRLVHQPTNRQFRLLTTLAKEMNVVCPRPASSADAKAEIRRMISEKRKAGLGGPPPSLAEDRVRLALGKRPRTVPQIAKAAGVEEERVHRALAHLEVRGRVYREMTLEGWAWSKRGRPRRR